MPPLLVCVGNGLEFGTLPDASPVWPSAASASQQAVNPKPMDLNRSHPPRRKPYSETRVIIWWLTARSGFSAPYTVLLGDLRMLSFGAFATVLLMLWLS